MILLNILRSSILIDVEGRWVDGPAIPDVTAKPKILKFISSLGQAAGIFPARGCTGLLQGESGSRIR
jgi:hypothetical protein